MDIQKEEILKKIYDVKSKILKIESEIIYNIYTDKKINKQYIEKINSIEKILKREERNDK